MMFVGEQSPAANKIYEIFRKLFGVVFLVFCDFDVEPLILNALSNRQLWTSYLIALEGSSSPNRAMPREGLSRCASGAPFV